jgi:hypothetical protein
MGAAEKMAADAAESDYAKHARAAAAEAATQV